MVDYQEFSSKFVTENRILKRGLAASLILNAVILIVVLTQKQYFVYQGGSLFKDKPLMEDICLSGFKGIVKEEPNIYEVTPEIIKLVEKEPFSMKIEQVYQVSSIGTTACKLILKADGKIQSFKIIMKVSDSYPLHYKLSEIVELTPNKEEM